MRPNRQSQKRQMLTSLGAIVVIAVIAIAVIVASKSSKKKATQTATTTAASAPAATAPAASSSATSQTYRDGSYSANGSYESPGGNESITVSITLRDDTVTATSTTPSPNNDSTAMQYEAMFIQGYPSLVIGKNIDSIQLSRVSGSSLTSQGFNAALAQIKNQARS